MNVWYALNRKSWNKIIYYVWFACIIFLKAKPEKPTNTLQESLGVQSPPNSCFFFLSFVLPIPHPSRILPLPNPVSLHYFLLLRSWTLHHFCPTHPAILHSITSFLPPIFTPPSLSSFLLFFQILCLLFCHEKKLQNLQINWTCVLSCISSTWKTEVGGLPSWTYQDPHLR